MRPPFGNYMQMKTNGKCVSYSVVSDSLRPHELQPIRLLCPCDFPGKNTGVGSHFPLQGMFLTQGLNLCLLGPLAMAGRFFTTSATWEACWGIIWILLRTAQWLDKKKRWGCTQGMVVDDAGRAKKKKSRTEGFSAHQVEYSISVKCKIWMSKHLHENLQLLCLPILGQMV